MAGNLLWDRDVKLHKRTIEVEATPIASRKVLIAGHLVDDHAVPVEGLRGHVYPPGVFHDIKLEIEVSLEDFAIEAARATMLKVPFEQCPEALEAVPSIVGLTLVSNFSRDIRNRLGGPRCCAHVVSLLTAMAPVVMQVAKESDELPVRTQPEDVDFFADTCRTWRRDGPILTRLKDQFAARDGAPLKP